MRDWLFAILWAGVLPMSLLGAHLAVLVWVWVALLPPTDLLYSGLGQIPFNKLMGVAAVFGLLFIPDRTRKAYIDPVLLLLLLYFLTLSISYFATQDPFSFVDVEYDKFWKEITLALVIALTITTRHRLHQLCLVISLAFGFVMAKEGLIFLLTAGGHKVVGLSSVGDNNGLALCILMTLPLMLYVARYSGNILVRHGIHVTALLGVVTVIATYSRGGFIGLITLSLMLLRKSRYKFRAILGLAVVAVVLFLLAPSGYVDRVDTITSATEDDSFMTRVVAWKINFLIAMDNPLLGGGPFACLDPRTWMKYSVDSSTFLFPTPVIQRSFVAHSIYFQVLGDVGFFGLALFLLLLMACFISLWKTRRFCREASPSLAWAEDLSRSIGMSLICYCVCGAALSATYLELFYIVVVMASRLQRCVADERRQHSQSPVTRSLRMVGRAGLVPSS